MDRIDPPTLVCTEAGVFAWPGYALVERRGAQFVRASEREIGRLSPARALAEFTIAIAPLVVDEAHALYSRFASRLDAPMSLDDLITRSYSDSPPSWPAYEEHHIVEAGPNKGLIPDALLQSRRNRVKIPYYIHRDISDFYSTKDPEYGN